MPIESSAVKRYLQEWMNISAISGFTSNDLYLFCSGENLMGERMEYRIEMYPESDGSFNIWARPFGSDVEMEWTDSINADSDVFDA